MAAKKLCEQSKETLMLKDGSLGVLGDEWLRLIWTDNTACENQENGGCWYCKMANAEVMLPKIQVVHLLSVPALQPPGSQNGSSGKNGKPHLYLCLMVLHIKSCVTSVPVTKIAAAAC